MCDEAGATQCDICEDGYQQGLTTTPPCTGKYIVTIVVLLCRDWYYYWLSIYFMTRVMIVTDNHFIWQIMFQHAKHIKMICCVLPLPLQIACDASSLCSVCETDLDGTMSSCDICTPGNRLLDTGTCAGKLILWTLHIYFA